MKGLRIRDERGTTLVELLVATASGMVVFFGLTMLVLASMHNTTRVTNRVHSTQNARTALQTVISELHSACVARFLAPIQEESNGTTLRFIHVYNSEAVSPTPTLSVITLTGTTLKQTDYPVASGSAPTWTFSTTASSSRALMSGVSAVSSSIPVFSYYKFSSGAIAATPITGTLTEAQAETVSKVDIDLKVITPGATVTDKHGAALVQDSALLRFTPPEYSTTASNLPCE